MLIEAFTHNSGFLYNIELLTEAVRVGLSGCRGKSTTKLIIVAFGADPVQR